jgi:hypothetical protein
LEHKDYGIIASDYSLCLYSYEEKKNFCKIPFKIRKVGQLIALEGHVKLQNIILGRDLPVLIPQENGLIN